MVGPLELTKRFWISHPKTCGDNPKSVKAEMRGAILPHDLTKRQDGDGWGAELPPSKIP